MKPTILDIKVTAEEKKAEQRRLSDLGIAWGALTSWLLYLEDAKSLSMEEINKVARIFEQTDHMRQVLINKGIGSETY